MGIIRVLLAVSVLITHSGPIFGIRLLGGDQAITCFYIISGFLMALILNEKYASRRQFYLNRALRIFPAVWIALIISMLLSRFTAVHPGYNPAGYLGAAFDAGSISAFVFAFISNVFLFFGELGRYFAFSPQTGEFGLFPNASPGQIGDDVSMRQLMFVPQAWTLSIELQFYLFAPFIARIRGAVLGLAAFAWIFVAISVRDAAKRHGIELDISAISLLQFPYFLLGMCGYWVYRDFSDCPLAQGCKKRVALCAYMAALVMIASCYWLERSGMIHAQLLYAGFALCVPFMFWLTRESTLDGRIGQLSYPIYIFHYMFSLLIYRTLGPAWQGELCLIVTVCFSFAYLALVDRPIEAVRSRIVTRRFRSST